MVSGKGKLRGIGRAKLVGAVIKETSGRGNGRGRGRVRIILIALSLHDNVVVVVQGLKRKVVSSDADNVPIETETEVV